MDIEHQRNDYDPTNFASAMRRCFANVMHRYPKQDGEDGAALFKRIHARIVFMRARLEYVYQKQIKHGRPADVVELAQFGVLAVNLINDGQQPEDITRMSNTKLLALARDAVKVEPEPTS